MRVLLADGSELQTRRLVEGLVRRHEVSLLADDPRDCKQLAGVGGFLADKSCDFAVVRALCAAGHDVAAVIEQGPAQQTWS